MLALWEKSQMMERHFLAGMAKPGEPECRSCDHFRQYDMCMFWPQRIEPGHAVCKAYKKLTRVRIPPQRFMPSSAEIRGIFMKKLKEMIKEAVEK